MSGPGKHDRLFRIVDELSQHVPHVPKSVDFAYILQYLQISPTPYMHT